MPHHFHRRRRRHGLALAAWAACSGASFAQTAADHTGADALPPVTVRATADATDTQPSLPQASPIQPR